MHSRVAVDVLVTRYHDVTSAEAYNIKIEIDIFKCQLSCGRPAVIQAASSTQVLLPVLDISLIISRETAIPSKAFCIKQDV